MVLDLVVVVAALVGLGVPDLNVVLLDPTVTLSVLVLVLVVVGSGVLLVMTMDTDVLVEVVVAEAMPEL